MTDLIAEPILRTGLLEMLMLSGIAWVVWQQSRD
jgi:hypothetical protein